MSYEDFRDIIHGSKEFTMNGTVLTIRGYYTGKRVKIDLEYIDEEMFDEIVYDDSDDEEDY